MPDTPEERDIYAIFGVAKPAAREPQARDKCEDLTADITAALQHHNVNVGAGMMTLVCMAGSLAGASGLDPSQIPSGLAHLIMGFTNAYNRARAAR